MHPQSKRPKNKAGSKTKSKTKSKERILLVEDEANLGSTLSEQLKIRGYQVCWAQEVEAAESFLKEVEFDLALLDVSLPDGSGFEVGQLIEDRYSHTSVIFLTAFSSPENRIRGLRIGAEDYIAKPFHLDELLLRIRNVLKRVPRHLVQPNSKEEEIKVGRALISFTKFQAQVENEWIDLSRKECSLLRLLVERKGQAVTRDEILDRVWDSRDYPSNRTVDNFIVRLRRIIEENPEKPELIRSIRGIGYQLL